MRERWWVVRFEMMMLARRWREWAVMAIAWHMPGWLVYWCAIRLMAHGTTGRYGTTDPSTLSVIDALKRWGD